MENNSILGEVFIDSEFQLEATFSIEHFSVLNQNRLFRPIKLNIRNECKTQQNDMPCTIVIQNDNKCHRDFVIHTT